MLIVRHSKKQRTRNNSRSSSIYAPQPAYNATVRDRTSGPIQERLAEVHERLLFRERLFASIAFHTCAPRTQRSHSRRCLRGVQLIAIRLNYVRLWRVFAIVDGVK